jgi:hypothetical protein
MSSLSCGTLYSTFVYLHTLLSCIRSVAETRAECWWFGGGVIPVLIPNTAVKPASGDGTHRL